jgi:hypothetical protein
MTMAAIGFFHLFSLKKRTIFFKTIFFSTIIILGIISLQRTSPFYFNYMNLLLPKNYLITDAWGYGGYEAAQYLNALPNADQMRVWSDYNGVCLFFNGKCEANFLTMKNIRKESGELDQFDYFVSSRRGAILSHSLWGDLIEDYDSKLIWEMSINNRPGNFIRIYKNAQKSE